MISYANLLLLDITVYFSKVSLKSKRLYPIEIQIKLSTEHQIRIDKRFGIIPIRKGYQGCKGLCTAYNKYPAVIEILRSLENVSSINQLYILHTIQILPRSMINNLLSMTNAVRVRIITIFPVCGQNTTYCSTIFIFSFVIRCERPFVLCKKSN